MSNHLNRGVRSYLPMRVQNPGVLRLGEAIVAIRLVKRGPVVKPQYTGVYSLAKVAREPKAIRARDGRLLQQKFGARNNGSESKDKRHRFDYLRLNPDPLVALLIDPHSPAHPGENFGFARFGNVTRFRRSVQHPGLMAIYRLLAA